MSSRHESGAEPPLPRGHLTADEIVADFKRRERDSFRRARAAGLTRREFFELVAAGAVLGYAGASARAQGSEASSPASASGAPTPSAASGTSPALAASPGRSRVIVVTHPEVILREYRVNPPVIRQMVDRAVAELLGVRTPEEAWRRLGREDDFVAIKHNSIGRPTLQSHTEINDAVAAQLVASARVKREKILAVDRTLPPPYNELAGPVTLPSRSLQTRLRRLYTEAATAIINVSVLKSHFGDGLSAALKNHLGSISNPAEYHGWEPDRLPRSIPELNNLAPLRTKTRLVIIDAIRPLFAAGPSDDPQFRWDYRGLIVSTDPVAAEAVGLHILEAKREEFLKKPWPMIAARRMIAHAQEIGLGGADPSRIDLVEVNMG